MSKRVTIILASLGLAASGALAQEAAPPGGEAGPSAEMKAQVAACAARKFETTVVLPGRDRGSKVRICGNEGQTDAQWIATLKDSALKAEANEALDAEVRAQIIAALKAEVARLEAAAKSPSVGAVVDIGPTEGPVAMRERAPEYSSLPSLPAPKPPVSVALGKPPSAQTGGGTARPRLTIRCALPGETYAECTGLELHTRVSVRAEEGLASGTSLRFRRGDKVRAELDLAGLQKGQSLRRKLPDGVCQGVISGKVWIEIVSKGHVADSLGPYRLNCGT